MEWTAHNGAPAPCPSRARALDVNFVIKQRVARPRHLRRAAAWSTQIFIWTILYRCEALDFQWRWNQVIWTSVAQIMTKLVTEVWAKAIKPGSFLGDGLWHKPVRSLETDWSGNRPSIGPIGLASLSDRSVQLSHVDRRLIRPQGVNRLTVQ
ncbi:hypothetical protein PIB30_029459 [Stylosanthes scabra]|uniref:Uncharacterized protein n=1 Tax=Stylosanthes scabra TaxID=79078 RepID=A0ABU6Z886_9FABA|nr:hypothetical protein [Stylosanthes scabra]